MHLCDIGNVAVPRAVLGYPGKINGPEWQFILLHTLVGERLLAGPLGMESVARLVRYSHERWDGAGYPHGLAGEVDPAGIADRVRLQRVPRHDLGPPAPRGARSGGRARAARARRRIAVRSGGRGGVLRGARRRVRAGSDAVARGVAARGVGP